MYTEPSPRYEVKALHCKSAHDGAVALQQ
jgi:hypothetical protein